MFAPIITLPFNPKCHPHLMNLICQPRPCCIDIVINSYHHATSHFLNILNYHLIYHSNPSHHFIYLTLSIYLPSSISICQSINRPLPFPKYKYMIAADPGASIGLVLLLFIAYSSFSFNRALVIDRDIRTKC